MFRNAILAAILGVLPAAAAAEGTGGFDPALALTDEALNGHRGGTYVLDNGDLVSLTAVNAGNAVNYASFGATNTIGADSFGGASGFFNVIQNAGSNVVIQTGVAINVEILP